MVPGAAVELTGSLTGIRRETKTNEAGLYRFDAVDLGEYRLTVTAPGFRTFVLQALTVAGGQVSALDVRLEVGQTSSTIEVTGEVQALQTEAPVRGGSLNLSTFSNLPLASRDVTAFALTLPGVVTNRFGFGVGTFSVNGSRGRSNNFMVDGVENNDVSVAGQLVQITNPDAIAEVSVQTSNFDAEYGRAGGAVVNTITKSGTNELHGSAMYLLDVTNDEAITNTQGLNAEIVKRGKPFYGIEQWYGFTLGGPIKRNRTFFFGSFQEQRQRSMSTNNLVTPTAAGRATLNSLFPKGANPRVDLYNQITAGVDGDSQPFSVVMGSGRPNVEFGTKIQPYAQRYQDRQFMFRVDHQISSRDQISARYMSSKQTSPIATTPFFPGFSHTYQYPSQNFVLSQTHVFSPTLTNELRLPYNRANLDYPIDTENPLGRTMPRWTIGGGITALGVATNIPQGRTVNNYAIQDTVSYVRGTHSFRAGATITQQRARQFAPIRERGEISYGTATGFSNFANFVDDFGGSGTVAMDFGSARYYPRYTRQAYFFQDRWRVNQDLTLTLGVRYEYFGTPMNSLFKSSWSGLFNVDPITAKGPYMDGTKVDPDKNNWSPTVGLAWSPSARDGILSSIFGVKRTVIRTGYQIGYDSFFNNIASNAKTATPNIIATSQTSQITTANPRGIANCSTMLPTKARDPLPIDSQTLMPKNLVNPYTQRWSFGIQRELPAMFVVDVSYVGSKGTRLYANEDMNPLVPSSLRIGPTTPLPLFTPVGRFDTLQGPRLTRTNGGDSNYHSLQMSADRRLANNLMVKVSYSWSKMIDNASEIFGVGNTNLPQNTMLPSMFGGLQLDRSVSFFDRTHRATFSYLYQFPFMNAQQGVLGRIVGGWQVSGLTSFETGVPLNVYNGFDADGIGGNFDRPIFNPSGQPGVRAQVSATSPTGYINPDAASAPINMMDAMYIGVRAHTGTVPLPTGNLGRNTLRVPGINNWNMNLSKVVRTVENVRLEFRSEFYNIWNHPQFGLGSVSPFSPGGGSMSADVGGSPAGRFLNKYFMDGGGRVIRYQLRLTF